MAWSTPATPSPGDVLTDSYWDTQVRDNLRYLKGLDGPPQIDNSLSLVQNTTGTQSLTISNPNGGASAYAAMYANTDSGQIGGLLRNSSTQTAYAGANSLNFFTVTTHPIGFITNNALRMYISGAGNVGIGTANPQSKLDVSSASFGSYAGATAAPSNTIIHNGNFGIGTNNPSYPLDISSSSNSYSIRAGLGIIAGYAVLQTNNYAFLAPNTAPSGTSYIGSGLAYSWTTYSSRRWKTNIIPLDPETALAMVRQLRGVRYHPIDGGKPQIGFIAEEVYQVVPEIVQMANDVDAEGMDYTRLTALHTAAISALAARLECLAARN